MKKENKQQNNFCVYVHANLINGKRYVGQTCNKPETRWRNGNGYKNSSKFYNAIKKYGWDNFSHEILLKNLSSEEANFFERYYIIFFNSIENGYNIEIGGSKGKLSDITKIKIGESNKKNKNFKKKMDDLRISKLGKPRSEETKQKISKALKGNSNSKKGQEHANFGKTLSLEHRRKISEALRGENHPMYGKQHSEDSKKKMSEARKGKKINYPKNVKRPSKCVKIFCVETNQIFNSIEEAIKEFKCSRSAIYKNLSNKTTKCCGYTFKRYKEN